ncbi:MAG: DNA polymerase IV [Gammaproteobacteria bacterium]|nr:DNA polymerase IV [Gammaproteobacteria bacterium]
MILHVDMDAFYASVEERDDPALVGRPVVVGGSPEGRGVVAAANYVARRYGIRSAMPAAQAKRLCPHAVFIRSRMDHYASVSAEIRAVFARYTPLIEPLSLDEAFLDVTASARLFGAAEEIAARIKAEVKGELGLVASVGVAPNKFLAKVASDLDKPDGLVVVHADEIEAFLDPLPVSRLWGVGKVSDRRFAAMGIRTIGDLRALPVELLEQSFGKWGGHLASLARGIDEREVVPEREAKSISHETTFERDIDDARLLASKLLALTEQVGMRLRAAALGAKTVFIKVRYADFRTFTRSRTLDGPSSLTRVLWREASRLLAAERAERGGPVRLLGMGVSGIARSAAHQGDLFEDAEALRASRIDRMADEIRTRFGSDSLARAGGARRPGR